MSNKTVASDQYEMKVSLLARYAIYSIKRKKGGGKLYLNTRYQAYIFASLGAFWLCFGVVKNNPEQIVLGTGFFGLALFCALKSGYQELFCKKMVRFAERDR